VERILGDNVEGIGDFWEWNEQGISGFEDGGEPVS
jgi:hypothetical protein